MKLPTSVNWKIETAETRFAATRCVYCEVNIEPD